MAGGVSLEGGKHHYCRGLSYMAKQFYCIGLTPLRKIFVRQITIFGITQENNKRTYHVINTRKFQKENSQISVAIRHTHKHYCGGCYFSTVIPEHIADNI